MEVVFTLQAKEDLDYWKKTHNGIILKKIRKLIVATLDNPYAGIGKPELLKHNLSGCWSRRINREHRLVYEVADQLVTILSIKGHYE